MLGRKQAGDTIVEVLIAMAVASAVIGGAYTVVNKTLANSRQAQEHSEALQIAQSQLEHLKTLAETDKTILSSSSRFKYFCINDSGDTVSNFSAFSSSDFTTQQTTPTPTKYPNACKGLGSVDYRVAVQYDNKATTTGQMPTLDDVVTVAVDWDGATGGYDHVSLAYKVMP